LLPLRLAQRGGAEALPQPSGWGGSAVGQAASPSSSPSIHSIPSVQVDGGRRSSDHAQKAPAASCRCCGLHSTPVHPPHSLATTRRRAWLSLVLACVSLLLLSCDGVHSLPRGPQARYHKAQGRVSDGLLLLVTPSRGRAGGGARGRGEPTSTSRSSGLPPPLGRRAFRHVRSTFGSLFSAPVCVTRWLQSVRSSICPSSIVPSSIAAQSQGLTPVGAWEALVLPLHRFVLGNPVRRRSCR
jgi:hypothetical protein